MARDNDRFNPDRTESVPYSERDESGVASVADQEIDLDELDDLEAEEEPQFLRAQRRVPVRKGTVNKKTANRLRIVVIVAVILGLTAAASAGIFNYGTHSWRFRLESSDNIESLGAQNVSRAQILEVMASDIGRNIFRVPLEERRKQLEEIPWVESATVIRLLPSVLRVEITERKPVAFVRIGSKIGLIDLTGVVMDMPAQSRSKYSFPVITGMGDSEPLSTRAARMKIYARLVGELDAGGTSYSKDLSEVDLTDPDDVRVTVEDPAGSLVIHLGGSSFADRYRIYLNHIQEWRQQFSKLESVDLRYNNQIIVNPDARGAAGRETIPAPEGPKASQ
ncbi:MAG TPA: FtsQ-type POTRA domain-containing protein [Terriglobales bacterium]|nr:FtsQ-type POTRA domain-containing protein [Terriglobales bacterium]